MATTTDERSELEKAADAVLNQEITLKDLKNISDEEMEAAYSVAYNFYQSGKYIDAERIFQFLAFFDNLEPKYWLGLGGCRELDKRYEKAAEAYMMCTLLDIKEPQAPIRAARCFEAMNDLEAAEGALHIAIEWSSGDEKHDLLKEQAAAHLARLEQRTAKAS